MIDEEIVKLRLILRTRASEASFGDGGFYRFIDDDEESRPLLRRLYQTLLISHFKSRGNLNLNLNKIKLDVTPMSYRLSVYTNLSDHRLCIIYRKFRPDGECSYQVSNPCRDVKLCLNSPILGSKISITLTGDSETVVTDLKRILNERGVYLVR